MPKIGDIRWNAWVIDEKVQFDKHVLRSIRTWNGTRYGYLVEHVHGVTWVKQSRKHGDWGYAKNVHTLYRTKFRIDDGLPYSATKAGALSKLAAGLRRDIAKHGENEKAWEDDPLTFGQELKKVAAAQKRLKIATKREGKNDG